MNTGSAPYRWSLSIIVVFFGTTIAFQIVRTAGASILLTENPTGAARAWPGHPSVSMALAMSEISDTASPREQVPSDGIKVAVAAARRAPLLIEPLIIKGAEAISKGRFDAAEGLFEEVRRRDPRSAAARTFLAQHYFETGRPAHGLAEASALTRLVPGGSTALVPSLARYAQSPGALALLRETFATNPTLAEAVLVELARDPSNANLVLALASKDFVSSQHAAPSWQAQLLHSLVEQGKYQEAHSVWRRFKRLHGEPKGLLNPRFAPFTAPSPFNWTLGSGKFGVAEPVRDGSLRVVYHGRRNGQFASQVLLLEPGNYQLRMQVRREGSPDETSGLGWSIKCIDGNEEILILPLPNSTSLNRTVTQEFSVPKACAAQSLVLRGTAREFSGSERVVISNLQLKGTMRS